MNGCRAQADVPLIVRVAIVLATIAALITHETNLRTASAPSSTRSDASAPASAAAASASKPQLGQSRDGLPRRYAPPRSATKYPDAMPPRFPGQVVAAAADTPHVSVGVIRSVAARSPYFARGP